MNGSHRGNSKTSSVLVAHRVIPSVGQMRGLTSGTMNGWIATITELT